MNIAIIFAGGKGIRMGSGKPKQFLEVDGKPILIHTLKLFQKHDLIDKIYLSVIAESVSYVKELVQEYHITKLKGIVPGGETSQDSIYNALLKAKEENPDDSIALISDGVRPFISYDTIKNNIEAVKEYGSAITCTPCSETILISENEVDVSEVPYRKNTFAAQAPQSFWLHDIIDAHEEIRNRDSRYENMIDACTIYKHLGRDVHMIRGNNGNIKVTTPEDVYIFAGLLRYRENEQIFGFGLTNTIG